MIKKIAGVWLCIFLASSIVYATSPFEGASISGEERTSDKNLETSDVSTEVVSANNSESSESATEENGEESNDDSKKSDGKFPVTGTIAANNLRIREWPWGPVLGKYNTGTKITVLGVSGEFYEVMVNGVKGYMHRSYISIPGAQASLALPSYPGDTRNGGYLTKEQGTEKSKDSASEKKDTSNNNNGNNSSNNNNGKAIITADSRVLHIGDSHCMGIYGKTIDGLMRETGATVKTEAFGGANPQWYMNGQLGVCGSYSKDENGKEVTTGANQKNTPLLKDMLGSYKPDVLVVSLGANMLAYPESTQRSMVTNLLDQAKAAGCKIVWVGPPDSSKLSDSSNEKLYKVLQSELPKYDGVLIDSRKYTKYPPGGDGIHYWGDEGVKQAKNWANEAMNVMTGK